MRQLGILGALVWTVGCGGAAATTTTAGPGTARIVDASGATIDFDTLIDRLAEARVVYVGERHDRAEDHEVQRAILEALHARDPNLAVGFEMFQQPFQTPLEAYRTGEIDLDTMLEQTEWRERWGFDVGLYEPLLRFGQTHQLPLIALNARREVTRTIGREGLEGLSEADRAALPELDRSQAAHRARFDEALRHHPGTDDARMDRFYTAQLVWDETMATQVAETMQSHSGRMIVFAGAMHVMRDAIPLRAARRGASPFAIVLPATEAPDEGTVDFVWMLERGRDAP